MLLEVIAVTGVMYEDAFAFTTPAAPAMITPNPSNLFKFTLPLAVLPCQIAVSIL